MNKHVKHILPFFLIILFSCTGTENVKVLGAFTGPNSAEKNTVSQLNAEKLIFSVEPSTSKNYNTLPVIKVSAVDVNNDVDTTHAGSVTISISTDPTSGTAVLSGSLSTNFVSGVAEFTDLSINSIADNFSFSASSTGLVSAVSVNFNIINRLYSNGIVVRYFLDEASSGTSPVATLDSTSTPFDIPINYDIGGSAGLSYTALSTGKGFSFTGTGLDSGACADINGTKIQTMLNGSKTGTIEVVFNGTDFSSSFSRVTHIGKGDLGADKAFTLEATNSNLYLKSFTSSSIEVDESTASAWTSEGRVVVTLVYDSTQAAGSDRVKLYKNGVEQTMSEVTIPALNDTLDLSATTHDLCLGNRASGSRTFTGELFYAAYYNTALTTQQVLDNYNELIKFDDE